MNRRIFALSSALLPLGQHLVRAAQTPSAISEPLALEGVRVLGLSPDESMLVGRIDDQMVVIDIASLEVVARSEPIPVVPMIDPEMVSWSTDSRHVAFTIASHQLTLDSDVYVFAVDSGDIRNLTPEGTTDEAESLLEADEVDIDLFPVWRDAESVYFLRATYTSARENPAYLMSMSLDDDEPTELTHLGDMGIAQIGSRLFPVADGSWLTALNSTANGISLVRLNADGTREECSTGAITWHRLLAASASFAVVTNLAEFRTWLVPLDEPEAAVLLDDAVGSYIGPFMTFDGTGKALVGVSAPDSRVLVYADGAVREIGRLPERTPSPWVRWVGDTVLVHTTTDAWVFSSVEDR